MKTLLQINTVANIGSTGKIAEEVGRMAIEHGWRSYIAYGRYSNNSMSNLIRIGSKLDNLIQLFYTRLFDRHGYGSKRATKNFIKQVKKLNPDVIHLHNIHGYYINIEILFNFLSSIETPIIWTLHDCWPYTGHCAYYSYVNCQKWKTHCGDCPQIHNYPQSFIDNSFKNFDQKRRIFNSIENLTLVPVSKWLENDLKQSFFKQNNIYQIYNGIDIHQFRPVPSITIKSKLGIEDKFIILGVASPWSDRKGLKDFLELNNYLKTDEIIILVGLSNEQISSLPEGIIGISKTGNVTELVELYNAADIFVNPTWEDNFPTTNLESLACGTPVITYDTGGSVEAVDHESGIIIEPGDIESLVEAIKGFRAGEFRLHADYCRRRVVENFNKDRQYEEYFKLYIHKFI